MCEQIKLESSHRKVILHACWHTLFAQKLSLKLGKFSDHVTTHLQVLYVDIHTVT